MKYKIKVHTIYEQGQRTNQEDYIYPIRSKESNADRLFILCDGMGGHAAGEVASKTVCETISKFIHSKCPDAEGPFPDDILWAAIIEAFEALDKVDTSESSPQNKMGTTMAFLKLHDEGCTIAHIGDSRVYHIRPGKDKEETKILYVTEDHSLVNDLIKIGELTIEEARHSKQKNVITRAMQPHMERRPKADVYHTSDIKPGDYFYLCSDGMLEQEEHDNRYVRFNFSNATGDEEDKVRILAMATSQNTDNHSAIIVHVMDVRGEGYEKPSDVMKASSISQPPMSKPITIQTEEQEISEEVHPSLCQQLFSIRLIPNVILFMQKNKRIMAFVLLPLLLGLGYCIRHYCDKWEIFRKPMEWIRQIRQTDEDKKDTIIYIQSDAVRSQTHDNLKEHIPNSGL